MLYVVPCHRAVLRVYVVFPCSVPVMRAESLFKQGIHTDKSGTPSAQSFIACFNTLSDRPVIRRS